MDNALHLRIFPVDAQVHTNLAGGLPLTAKQVAVQIDLHEHFLGHKSLGNAGRGRPQLRFAYAAADVAVIGSDKALFVHPPSNFKNLMFCFIIVQIFRMAHETGPFHE